MSNTAALTNRRLLLRNSAWSLLGQALPLLAALVSIPALVHGLGIERFGVLTLVWLIVGYFGLFDLGLGWAVTRTVSEELARGHEQDVPAVVWTAHLLMLAAGLLGAVLLAVLAPWLARTVLSVPPALQVETARSFRVLAASLPFVTATAGLAGVLAAHQRFRTLNAIRIPMGAFSYVGPLLVLFFSNDLVPVVSVLVAGRIVGWATHLVACMRVAPRLRSGPAIHLGLAAPLLRFGGWITVSNLAGPIIVYADRFLIGGMISMASVAWYATPYDLASRLWLVSSPVVAVLFPAFAASFSTNPVRTERLFVRGIQYVFLALFPCTLLLTTLAPEGLRYWLGPEFAARSARVLQWLAIAVFLNGLGQVAMALVQSVGRPGLSGRLHLIELPLSLALTWWAIRKFGIEGAALASLVRIAVDTLVLLILAYRILPGRVTTARLTAVAIAAALVTLATPLLLPTTGARVMFAACALVTFATIAWRRIVGPARDQAGGFGAVLR